MSTKVQKSDALKRLDGVVADLRGEGHVVGYVVMRYDQGEERNKVVSFCSLRFPEIDSRIQGFTRNVDFNKIVLGLVNGEGARKSLTYDPMDVIKETIREINDDYWTVIWFQYDTKFRPYGQKEEAQFLVSCVNTGSVPTTHQKLDALHLLMNEWFKERHNETKEHELMD